LGRPLIPFLRPRLPPLDAVAAYFSRSENARWFTNYGPCYALLVERLESLLGRQLRCVPLANATLALMLGLRALVAEERRAGKQVLLPSFTFAATVNAVLWAGLEPVFVDVEAQSWHLSPEGLAGALDEKAVAAVVACSTFGTPPPRSVRDAWRALARDARVPVLVDSAPGFGAQDEDGRLLGATGDAEVFSFHATKPFAIGEGGLLVSADAEVAGRVARLANFGFEDGIAQIAGGLNAKLAEWPAATALAALDGFDQVLATRRHAAEELLAALEPLGFVRQHCDGRPAWQFVPVLAPSAHERDHAFANATAAGVELRRYFSVPLHRMPAFKNLRCAGSMTTTDELAERVLSLPMADDQTPTERTRIVETLAAT
jgi:dTDP-4-amino-4,6-dideoxygalactose transaminase